MTTAAVDPPAGQPPAAAPTTADLCKRLSKVETEMASLKRWVLGIVIGSEVLRSLGVSKETIKHLLSLFGS